SSVAAAAASPSRTTPPIARNGAPTNPGPSPAERVSPPGPSPGAALALGPGSPLASGEAADTDHGPNVQPFASRYRCPSGGAESVSTAAAIGARTVILTMRAPGSG